MSRLIVANLDAEDADLPLRVRRAASAAGTLLRAFAEPGDRLWTPLPVAPRRVPDLRVTLVSGPLPRETPAVQWRARDAVADRVNHRRFAFDLGPALPGARWVTDADAFEPAHAAWLLKTPQGSAGRGQVRRRVRHVDAETRARIRRLVARHGALLYEPWVDRVADFGVVGYVTDGGVDLRPPHRLLVHATCAFRGIVLDPELDRPELTAAARRAGDALRAAGYRGPFGIDAFDWRDASGQVHLHPMCEINARLTFGHVAWAVGEPPLALRLSVAGARPPAGATPLLLPDDGDPTCAWVVRGSRPSLDPPWPSR